MIVSGLDSSFFIHSGQIQSGPPALWHTLSSGSVRSGCIAGVMRSGNLSSGVFGFASPNPVATFKRQFNPFYPMDWRNES